ncbi:hypothetical protein [Actinokineospora sp. NBRC 105648]|uniref:hypothetical protein n=1 Tax=Actinokineospora sp. NBRC 105648 TaxID=3032206 RepID=UPI0024A4E8C3|nr:hypothetical protein [Actinokineospora sp. NBRC 105648]GLZ37577.1 hypothetical protein Acsp05_12020 [Actinokineospora sp. NBRC 105648]
MNQGVQTEVRGPVGQFKAFFRLHWTRGAAGRETPDWVWHFAYRTWLLALLFKLLGSSWDESWHFKFLRDDLAPPHLINSVGTGIAVVLVAIHSFTGMAATRRSQRLVQYGLGVFLVAAPLDVINHRVNGLDLTAWSPSHALLYLGTALMIAGLIDGWVAAGPRGRAWAWVLGGLWVFFLENTLFPNGQQEYGTLEMASCTPNGVLNPDTCYAERELLEFAANQIHRPVDYTAIEHFAMPIPDWVYPMWGIGVAALILAAAGKTINHRWAATAVAGAYVAYRAVIWPLLVAADFPPSTVPFYLLFVGLAVDLVRRLHLANLVEAVTGAAAITVLGHGALYAQEIVLDAPPVAWWSAPITFVLVAALWAAGRPTALWLNRKPVVAAA